MRMRSEGSKRMILVSAQSGKTVVIECIYSSAIYFPAIYLYFVVFRAHSLSFVPLNLPRSKNQCQHDSDQASDWGFDVACHASVCDNIVGVCCSWVEQTRGCGAAEASGRDAADGCDLQDRDRCDDC